MTSPVQQLRRLPARPVGVVLEAIEQIRQARRDDWTLPLVSLFLTNGATIRGEYLSGHELGTAQASILLRTVQVAQSDASSPGFNAEPNDARPNDVRWNLGLDVTYIPVANISALTLHHTPDTIARLSFGAVRERSGEAPSRLELERRLRALTDWVRAEVGCDVTATIAWEAFPRGDTALLDLGALIADLRLVLGGFAADDLGRAALRESLQSIVVNVGEAAAVTLQSGELRYTVGLDGMETRLFDSQELRRVLAARL
ncbi:hypothetical protein J8C06_02010 [Chloracidobacterium validum]|uniref:Uncharacterized protein n=1 Tax=Chloracidobacterium validum TaxID=2821543 RepID=A0ABX8BC73_9BACT|nr:hypothetical protein [Chloracidobacterium validum]QUW03238.1 hypothetical protein J8C06_02010 [Chloracidobacterium validum]